VMNYSSFLKTKSLGRIEGGVLPSNLPDYLYGYQKTAIDKLLTIGRGAAFLDTGLGKTAIQLEWARQISQQCPVIILCPLAVAEQTQREGLKFGVDAKVCRQQSDVVGGITITNYERIHQFDCSQFGAVVLDESSILKGVDSKTKKVILSAFGHTKYRLACSATPAPNDYMEIGQQSEVLGVMRVTDMLSRWFINDSAKTGEWRLKGHARKDYWSWVKSWAVVASKPSDLGDMETVYQLPKLSTHEEVIDHEGEPVGDLFHVFDASATGIRNEKKASLEKRIERVAEIAAENDEYCIVWTDTNDESLLATKSIHGAVEVTGSMSLDEKESRLASFSRGDDRVLVTKPSIAGFGLNWQHCARMVFAGTTYSYEKYYQAVRRCWRFGQKRPVNVHVVMSEAERLIWRVVEEKAEKHQSMIKEVLAA
jgi:superfamily II DNA or RNA helicase